MKALRGQSLDRRFLPLLSGTKRPRPTTGQRSPALLDLNIYCSPRHYRPLLQCKKPSSKQDRYAEWHTLGGHSCGFKDSQPTEGSSLKYYPTLKVCHLSLLGHCTRAESSLSRLGDHCHHHPCPKDSTSTQQSYVHFPANCILSRLPVPTMPLPFYG